LALAFVSAASAGSMLGTGLQVQGKRWSQACAAVAIIVAAAMMAAARASMRKVIRVPPVP
jgi:hypothetical protein